jgi:hypothetical protein
MLTDSRFVDQEFPILIQREALDERQEKQSPYNSIPLMDMPISAAAETTEM